MNSQLLDASQLSFL